MNKIIEFLFMSKDKRAKKELERRRAYCKEHGHNYRRSGSSEGDVVGKGYRAIRKSYECRHCGDSYYKDIKLSKIDSSKQGYSWGSEGTCANCANSNNCGSVPWSRDDPTRQQAFVYTGCPINNFKPHDEKQWKKDMKQLGDLMTVR